MNTIKSIGAILGLVSVLGLSAPALAYHSTTPNISTFVNVSGHSLPSPHIASNAIKLRPGQSIPINAPVGQEYIIPPRPLPQNIPVIRVNPGQGYTANKSTGTFAVIPHSNYPLIAIVAKPPSQPPSTSGVSALSTTVPAGVKSHTAIMTAYFPVSNTNGCTYSAATGGLLNFNTWWVADNHVYSCYNPNTGYRYNPTQLDVFIVNSSGNIQQELKYYDLGSVVNQNYGLASPTAIVGASVGNITIVLNPSLYQWDTAVSAYGAGGSFGWFTQPLQLLAVRVYPPGGAFPDPYSPVYHEFSAHGNIVSGWSGSGTWDSSGRLVAITTLYNDTNTYGFDGGDIVNFANAVGIPYNTYNE